jgi:putative protease
LDVAPSIPVSPSRSHPPRRAPELLAPAGDWDCAKAAIENGADAVYFGLDTGFNARARAHNFAPHELEPLMAMLHRRGVLGYVTLNTLVFASELRQLAQTVTTIAQAGVDAVLVQDLGVARLVRELCPDLDVHASTQMTMTSAETIAAASDLGLRRVVLARELSLDEIRAIAARTEMPLESFIHGALCVAYSGQCLTSESLGGRSANRGQCAQACRLPYELIVDGRDRPLGDVRYLLSPQDLAGYASIPALIEAGVASLKIEGRLKTPEYVANITAHYRGAIDAAMAERPIAITDREVREMEMSFSRGFSPGWLEGNNHKRLVPGTESSKRGVLVGHVIGTRGARLAVDLDHPVALGDGLAFDGDRVAGEQQGGRVYGLRVIGQRSAQGLAQGSAQGSASGPVERVEGGEVEIEFARGKLDLQKIAPGARVWKNDDPELNRRLRRTFQPADPIRRSRVDFTVHAAVGQPLRITARSGQAQVEASSDSPLAAARNRPATSETIAPQIARLGGTQFELGHCDCLIEGEPMVPTSLLNDLRRTLVTKLDERLSQPPERSVDPTALDRLLREAGPPATRLAPAQAANVSSAAPTDAEGRSHVPALRVLCRTTQQLRAVATSGVSRLYVDFHDIREYREAVTIAHAAGVELYIASVRIQKPKELGLLKVLARHGADGFLVRNLAALDHFRTAGYPVVGDFSLNVVNPLTADWLLARGCQQVTASYDLNRDQLLELAQAMPAEKLEVVLHQHMPMFHMEHCVFCSVLSPGTDKTNCGRPCDRHQVRLRDRVGMEHPLQADVGCRNTLYNAVAQSGAEAYADLAKEGIGSIRVELLEGSDEELLRTVRAYQELIAGRMTGSQLWRSLSASNRVGVTRGTLEAPRNPLTIL